MRYRYLWAIACCLLPLCTLAAEPISTEPAPGTNHASITSSLPMQSISFTRNLGQWADSILFRASAGDATLWLTRQGIYYQFSRRISPPHSREGGPALDKFSHEQDSLETTIVKAQFVSANPHTEVIGLEKQASTCNYFLGDDPSNWRTNVPTYSGVTYKDIYPGVDATLRSDHGTLSYELHGSSDALAKVQIAYNGAKSSPGIPPQTLFQL